MASYFDPLAHREPIEARASWHVALSIVVPLLGALACSGSSESGPSGSSGGQTVIPSTGGAQVGVGGGSSTGGTTIGNGGVAVGTGGGMVGQGGTPGCTQQCSGNSLTTTCSNSQSTQDCGTICRGRGLVGTACVGTDCACTSGQGGAGGGAGAPSCTTECAGPGSLRTTCGGSVHCACQTITGAGDSGTGGAGSGTGGAATGCTTVCKDDPANHQATYEQTTCIDAQGSHDTFLVCIASGGPCEQAGLATCENNACKCL